VSRNPELSLQIVHFSKLVKRREALQSEIPKNLAANWVSEKEINVSKVMFSPSKSPFGISTRLIGMDLGVNSRSLTRSRRKSQIEGWGLLAASYFDYRRESLVAKSVIEAEPLKASIKENLLQHIECLRQICMSGAKYGLILEDDALPSKFAFEQLQTFLKERAPRKRFILFCGSGAELTRTSSDFDCLPYGIYKTRGYFSRTAVATIYSQDVAKDFFELLQSEPLPNWAPIDFLTQIALRKIRCKSYWQDPPWFIQGSESGEYQSSLR
jgi:hypothetical protein